MVESLGRSYRRGSAGFTLVEALVVMGLVLLLVSLAIPAIGRSMTSGRETAALSAVRSMGALTQSYAQTYGVYPIINNSFSQTSTFWPDLYITLGYTASYRTLDPFVDVHQITPGGTPTISGNVSIALSQTLCTSWEQYVPGSTPNGVGIPPITTDEDWPVVPVREDMVTFPSDKGLACYAWILWGARHGPACCLDGSPPMPVVFCDGHAEMARWPDLVKDGILVLEGGVGSPVGGTWYGYRGRDRRH
jgi:type II secretory pathway pseudopilin PulG